MGLARYGLLKEAWVLRWGFSFYSPNKLLRLSCATKEEMITNVLVPVNLEQLQLVRAKFKLSGDGVQGTAWFPILLQRMRCKVAWGCILGRTGKAGVSVAAWSVPALKRLACGNTLSAATTGKYHINWWLGFLCLSADFV